MAFSSSAWNYQEPVNTNQKPCEHITVMVELKVSNKCLKIDVIWLVFLFDKEKNQIKDFHMLNHMIISGASKSY